VLLQARGNGPIDPRPELGAIHASLYTYEVFPVHHSQMAKFVS
jgi:hypothetical protein